MTKTYDIDRELSCRVLGGGGRRVPFDPIRVVELSDRRVAA
jgi:hypothetical protein